MRLKKKKQSPLRNREEPLYKKQQAYHYSAHRQDTDKVYGRRQFDEDGITKKQLFRAGRLKYLPSFLSIGLLVISVLYLLNLSPRVSLATVGDKEFIGDKIAVQAKADEYMKSSLLNRSKLSFDSQKLEDKLRAEFPEFVDISVKTYLFRHTPQVEIKFATPTIVMTDGSKVYVLSEEGVVLADITTQVPSYDTSELPLVKDETGVAIEVGKVALTNSQVDYIKTINYQTAKKKLTTQSITLIPGGGEIHVRYGGIDYFVKYNLFEDARESSGTFLATKANLEKLGVKPAEYIDVRVPERAYIK